MNDNDNNFNILMNSQELAQVPNVVKKLLQQMNNKIELLTNKLEAIENSCEDMITKEHLNKICANKVDINDFLNNVNNIDQEIKQKPTMEDIQYLSEDKVSKAELNNILSNYINRNDYPQSEFQPKSSYGMKEINHSTNNQMDSLLLDINKKFNSVPTFQDLDKINKILAKKANLSDIQNILSFKVDKEDMINLLKTKADYNYIDEELKKKLDVILFEKIQNEANSKANLDMDRILEEIDKKIDAPIINDLMKLINNKIDHKYLNDYINELLIKDHKAYDTRFKAFDIDFDRFIESVKAQFNNVNQALNKLSKDKVDKTFFEERLDTKLDIRNLAPQLDKISQESKMKLNEISLKNQENVENINLKIGELSQGTADQFEGLKDDIRNIIKELNSINNSVQYNFDVVIKEKNNNDFYKTDIGDKLKNISEKLEAKVSTNVFNKNIIKIQEDLKNYVRNISQEKITYTEVEQIIKTLCDKNDEALAKYKNDSTQIINNIDEKISALDKNKITVEDLNEALDNKVKEINNELDKRASVNDFVTLTNKMKNISNNLSTKLDVTAFEENKKQVNDVIEKINGELADKYSKSEEENLLNEKCSLDTFNTVIKELNNAIDSKLDSNEYHKFLDIQEVINNIYLTENSTGIWKWVSNKLYNGYIPLEIEYYNTMRDNYLWEEDRTSLMILNKGVYNIKIVIFTSDTDIKVTLVVNGENVVSRNGGDHEVGGSNPKNNKFALQKIKIDEYITINDKIRVSILFNGRSNNSRGYLKISSVHYEQDKDFDIKNTKFMEERLNDNKTFPLLGSEMGDSSQRVKE